MGQTVDWIDPDGATTTLVVTRGAHDLFMPPTVSTFETIPGRPGAKRRTTRHGLRKVTLPGVFGPDNQVDHRDNLRDLAVAFDPTRGDGKLRVTGPDTGVRELNCRYDAGLGLDYQIATFQRAALDFVATDPYWYDATDTIVDTELDSSPATFFPFFPIALSSSEVFGAFTITNTGDVTVWPIFTFRGPGSAIVARNLTTDLAFSLTNPTDLELSAEETVTVDTRPDRKAVTLQDGTNLFSTLTADSALWALVKGTNSIQIEMSGATTDSLVRVTYRLGYLVP